AASPASESERSPAHSRAYPVPRRSRFSRLTEELSCTRVHLRRCPQRTHGMQSMLRTRSGLPKFCTRSLDREGGKWRIRFRRHGFSTYIPGTPWSEEFMRAYADALDGTKAQASDIGAGRTRGRDCQRRCERAASGISPGTKKFFAKASFTQ